MGGGGLDGYNRKWKIGNRQDVLTIFGIMTLLIGLGISALIYLTVDNYENSFLGYEVVGGSAYPIRPEDSKTYQRDLQLVGGKAYVLIDEFQRWFTGLWHGKSLAYLVFGITLLVSSGFFYSANNMPSQSKDDDRGAKNRSNSL
jgi:hypothetical protein